MFYGMIFFCYQKLHKTLIFRNHFPKIVCYLFNILHVIYFADYFVYTTTDLTNFNGNFRCSMLKNVCKYVCKNVYGSKNNKKKPVQKTWQKLCKQQIRIFLLSHYFLFINIFQHFYYNFFFHPSKNAQMVNRNVDF